MGLVDGGGKGGGKGGGRGERGGRKGLPNGPLSAAAAPGGHTIPAGGGGLQCLLQLKSGLRETRNGGGGGGGGEFGGGGGGGGGNKGCVGGESCGDIGRCETAAVATLPVHDYTGRWQSRELGPAQGATGPGPVGWALPSRARPGLTHLGT